MNIPNMQEIYDIAYIRGSWDCPKCGFVLTKRSINAETGDIGTTEKDRQSEQCPNDGEWMVPSTYKNWLEQIQKVTDELMFMRHRLRELIKKTKEDGLAEDIQFFAGIVCLDDIERIAEGQPLDSDTLCFVCQKPILETGSAIPVDGKWEPVHIGCYHTWMDDRKNYDKS